MPKLDHLLTFIRAETVEDILRRVHRVLPLRNRHVLTRRNTLRLRYVALPVLAVVVTGGIAVTALTQPGAMVRAVDYAVLEPAAGTVEDDQGLITRLAVTQKRLQRYAVEGQLDPALSTDGQTVAITRAAATMPEPKQVKIGPGDTLTGALLQAGLSDRDAYGVVQAMKEHVNPRSLRPGQILQVTFDPQQGGTEGGNHLAQVKMDLDSLKTVTVARQGEVMSDDGAVFKASMTEKPVYKKVYTQAADISVSVLGSAAKAGIPSSVINDAIRIYSWDVDFQRDIRQGDRIEVTYESYETAEGKRVKTGDLLYTKLSVSGIDIPLYRYETAAGRLDYFQPNGRSIRKTLMKTPIDGARVSSGFGARRHPVLGYTKMHKGVDFAAPTGTPIYAAGDGVIEKAGRFSSFGNYVRIRHNGQLKTAYAHMSRFGKGISPGVRVRQGQVIGYVGTTGRSTGPHLHYEVLVGGVQKNPRSLDLPTGETLEGEDLRLFKAHVRQMDRGISDGRALKFAQNNADE